MKQAKTKIKLISVGNEENPILKNIVNTVNDYLLKNQGAANDFATIKDIVDRNCDAIDDEISQRLPVPLYLGLMGTVLGIIIGLFSLGSDVTTDSFYLSIGGLLSSIKFAMICSFVGLLLTTVLTAWAYRGAKAELEEQKNKFFSFIQMQLMPSMTQNAASTIMTMQQNLTIFNREFKTNVDEFHGVMDKLEDVFGTQLEVVKDIKSMDIEQIANLNVNVMKELKSSMKEFEKFNQYLGMMNSFVHNTAELNDSVSAQLKRTGAIEDIVGSLKQNIENNRLVMTMLEDFLSKVDANEAIKHASAELDNTLSTAIDEIKLHVQNQIEDLKKYTSEATARLGEFVKIAPDRKHESNDITVTTDNREVVAAINALGESFKMKIDGTRKDIEKINKSRSPLIANICLILITLSVLTFGILFLTSNNGRVNDTSETVTVADSDSITATMPAKQVDTTATMHKVKQVDTIATMQRVRSPR